MNEALLQTALKRIIPSTAQRKVFLGRLHAHGPRLRHLLAQLYGARPDFETWHTSLIESAAQAFVQRPDWLHKLDAQRARAPGWFQSNQMLGAVCYVDLYAKNLAGLRAKIPYFKQMGVTYLHLMPLFSVPEPENDGGYAVSSYRQIQPKLGNMKQFAQLLKTLRENGISTCVDFIFNHTSDEHEWAMKAKAGDPDHRDFYIFVDRPKADEYEKNLREIFPDEHPGSFSPAPSGSDWVWTTFHTYQWDLNYANPRVFQAMAGEMLFLANQGIEVLRMDAVAFIWKRLGTTCENLPEAHTLIQAFNALCRIVAPSLLFKSEAIVHPDDVAKYISPEECQISYNPLLMALLWNSLATREVRLLRKALAERHAIHPETAWVNYVRVHDDIGWTFSDEDAASLGINGFDHRKFLNQFYTHRFEGSFARGLPFQENPKTGDCRISGTCASLAGLEAAQTEAERELALRRILLIHGIVLAAGGIPLLYLGDEQAQLNDYAYQNEPTNAHDSRWVHRPINPEMRKRSAEQKHTAQNLYVRLQSLINTRQSLVAFSGGDLRVIDTAGDHVLGFIKGAGEQRVLVLANFSERAQLVPGERLAQHCPAIAKDAITDTNLITQGGLALSPYQMLWLQL